MRHRNYALLWTGQLISQVGDRLQWIVISLWVYAQTGSALSVSYAMMAFLIAPAVVGLFAGALVDRWDRRKILVYCDLIRAALVFAIPDLMRTDLAWVYLDLFLVSVAGAFFRPAMLAAIQQSVPKDRLLQGNAFFASMSQSTEVFGPVLAGIVIAWRGYEAAIYVNAISYLLSMIFVTGLRLKFVAFANSSSRSENPFEIFRLIREGFQYIRGDRVQMALLALLLGGMWLAGLDSLQTALAKGELSVTDRQFTWFQSVWGIGFVAGSLLLGWYGGRLPKGQMIVFAHPLYALAAAMMGLSANYGMLVVTGFWVGFANMLAWVNVTTVIMEHTPSDKIGRTLAIRQMVIAAIRATALVGFGWLADQAGTRAAILAMGAISFAGSLLAVVRFPVLWRYRVEGRLMGRSVGVTTGGLAVTSAFGALAHYLDLHSDPQFAVSQQRALNAVSLVIVGIGWLMLLAAFPVPALGVVAALGSAIALASLARLARGRLRSPPEGHKTGR